MIVEVIVPKWGTTMEDADLVAWLVTVDDVVALDQPIAELDTDKISNELPSPAAGRVIELLVAVGETVDVGQVIARIEEM